MPLSFTAHQCKENRQMIYHLLQAKGNLKNNLLNKNFQAKTLQMFLAPDPAIPKTPTVRRCFRLHV